MTLSERLLEYVQACFTASRAGLPIDELSPTLTLSPRSVELGRPETDWMAFGNLQAVFALLPHKRGDGNRERSQTLRLDVDVGVA